MHGKVETTKTLEFRSKLGFKQYDIIITNEESVKKKCNGRISKWISLQHNISGKGNWYVLS